MGDPAWQVQSLGFCPQHKQNHMRNDKDQVPQTFTSKAIPSETKLAGAAVASHRVRTVGIIRADPGRQTLINICRAEEESE